MRRRGSRGSEHRERTLALEGLVDGVRARELEHVDKTLAAVQCRTDQLEVSEAPEAHVGVEQDVQREEAETLLGSESGSRYSAKIFRTVHSCIPRTRGALYTWPSTC